MYTITLSEEERQLLLELVRVEIQVEEDDNRRQLLEELEKLVD